jgi:hypothetical protein
VDALQCAYYLSAPVGAGLDFQELAVKREELKSSYSRGSEPVVLGNTEFLLAPFGSKPYSFMISNPDFKILIGENIKPNFFVTFKSEALWRESAYSLHEKFLTWARSLGFTPYQPEGISRLDYCFDYNLPEVDFNEDSFKSKSAKDSQYRENGKAQTFSFGRGDVVLRMYDKVAEIDQQSHKTWFFDLWGQSSDVWRIEWQVRKEVLKRFDIRTFNDLATNLGALLNYLANDHDTLRIPSNDSNSSRWPLHPLWVDLQEQIANLPNSGILCVFAEKAAIVERMRQRYKAIYGYLKGIAALQCVRSGQEYITLEETIALETNALGKIHDSLCWSYDVKKKVKEIELGQW